MVTAPIWKDTNYLVSASASPFIYSIDLKLGEDDEQTIFEGKAWARPKSDYISININKIAQDYVGGTMPDLRTITRTTDYVEEKAFRTFYLKDEDGNTLNTYRFLYDWSYEEPNFSDDIDLVHTINGHYAPNMLYFNSWWDNDTNNGGVHTVVTPDREDCFDFDDNLYYTKEVCSDWVLYYKNRYGGTDCFVIEGKVVQKDDYERHNISKSYNNTSIDFHKVSYNNQITTTYEVHSGWLSDSQSQRLAFNLMPSNTVYLHNLASDDIIPVLITDSSVEFKSFKNQNHHMANYTITLEASQKKLLL